MSTKYHAHRFNLKPFSKPYVIVITGYVGSGKSAVAVSLSKILENAPILFFDHYERYIEWSQDMNRCIKEGADRNQIRNISPWKSLPDEREWKSGNLLIWFCISMFHAMCVIRLVERVIDMEVRNAKGAFETETKENLAHQRNAVATWITHYQRTRPMYMPGNQMTQ